MPLFKNKRAASKPARRKVVQASSVKRARRAASRSPAKSRSASGRKYLSPAMLEALIRESPTPAIANETLTKPPFDLQED